MSDDSYTPKGIQVYQGTHRPPTDPHRTGAEIAGYGLQSYGTRERVTDWVPDLETWGDTSTPVWERTEITRSITEPWYDSIKHLDGGDTERAAPGDGYYRLEQHGKFGLMHVKTWCYRSDMLGARGYYPPAIHACTVLRVRYDGVAVHSRARLAFTRRRHTYEIYEVHASGSDGNNGAAVGYGTRIGASRSWARLIRKYADKPQEWPSDEELRQIYASLA